MKDMNSEERTDSTIETKPTVIGASWATRLVAVVISALVYGALVYLSRFTPHLFGIWFQFWGALGLVLGTIISQLPAGLNPLIWIPANLAQSLYALLPALF